MFLTKGPSMFKYCFRFAIYLFVAIGISVSHAGAYEDFFQAVGRDDAGTVEALLQRGFDPNSRDEKGQTGLYLSQREGSLKVAALLLSHPQSRVDLANGAGETALMMAALRGNVDWVGRLLDKGAAIEGPAAGAAPGWTPLHYAASAPDAKAVALLLARGARIDSRSPNGTTPLMMAAQYGNEESVKLLLKQGGDLRLRNDLGLDAAEFARRGGRDALAASLAAAAR